MIVNLSDGPYTIETETDSGVEHVETGRAGWITGGWPDTGEITVKMEDNPHGQRLFNPKEFKRCRRRPRGFYFPDYEREADAQVVESLRYPEALAEDVARDIHGWRFPDEWPIRVIVICEDRKREYSVERSCTYHAKEVKGNS